VNTLYPYQDEGVRFLRDRNRAYLADGMGLGKTVQAAVAAYQLKLHRVLEIAPASALENWRREWSAWGPKTFSFGAISYADTHLREGRVNGSDWDLVILDEAHYCKNHKAKRTLAALKVARAAPRAWLLSGTPMPNNTGELYAVLRMLWPEKVDALGIRTFWQWFNHFNHWTQTRYGPRAYGVKNGDELRSILSGIMLRRRLEDVAMDLPDLRIETSLLPRDPAFAKMLADAGVNPDDPEGSTSRLRHILGSYKAPKVGEILARELEDGAYSKIVVLAYHHIALDDLRTILAPFGVVGFDGGAPQPERQRAIDRFTNDKSCRVFLAQQNAAGIAINLQAAHEIVLVEPAWTPDDNLQAIKRIHRIGQDSPCRARIFAVAGSLDEAVMGVVANKLRMQREVGLA